MLINCYSHTVHEYHVRRLQEIMAERRFRIARLKTRKDAENYVRRARTRIREIFGPFPKKTPLNAIVTGRDEYRHYDIEKVMFESRPGFLVTGNLYLPKSVRSGKRCPAVLGLCGHSSEGKGAVPYQSFCQGLAIRGFIVFIIDPVSQGERRQFYPRDGGKRPALCKAHSLMGNQMGLAGDFFGSWRAWDAIRALDYMLSRPETDRTHVGVTGNSGGGTLSTYMTALDPRLTMAAPSCYICSYLANMENELPGDSEQNPPGILAAGLDQVDLLLCYAPRPTLILGQYDDYFDARYVRSAFEDLNRIHAMLGSRGSAKLFVGPDHHGFFKDNREAMYSFFMKHAGITGKTARESGIAPVDPTRLFAAPRGEVSRAGSTRVFEFTAEKAKLLSRKRGNPGEKRVKETAKKLLAMPKTKGPPSFRVLCSPGNQDPLAEKNCRFSVLTEPGIQVIVTCYGHVKTSMHPPKGNITLYIGHISGEEDVRNIKHIRNMIRGKRPLVVADPRGIGQSMSKACGYADFFAPHGSDFFYAATGDMLNESYLGRRVFDVMRVMDFLLDNGAGNILLVGRGLGSITAAFAALLHPHAPRVQLINYLPGYDLIASSPLYAWPLSSLLRGCLLYFDLPDVYRILGSRLTKQFPWDARMKPLRNKKNA